MKKKKTAQSKPLWITPTKYYTDRGLDKSYKRYSTGNHGFSTEQFQRKDLKISKLHPHSPCPYEDYVDGEM